jgi:choline dehydrogenase-like flavoprotein
MTGDARAGRLAFMSDTSAAMHADVLVIGWGEAGKTLARALGSQGHRVVPVERSRASYGGPVRRRR